MARARGGVWIAVAMTLACTHSGDTTASNADLLRAYDPTPEPPASHEEQVAARRQLFAERTTATLSWRNVPFPGGALDLELPAGDYDGDIWPTGAGLQQVIGLSDDSSSLTITVRVGDNARLDRFDYLRTSLDAKFSEYELGAVCGQASRSVEIRVPEEDYECVEYADGRPSAPYYAPPMTIVALYARLPDERDMLATWEIETALRERYLYDEARFFAGITCSATSAP